MSLDSSLPSRLAAVLPQGVDVLAYHLSTPPSPVNALFASLPGHEQENTFCESHFLAVAAPKQDDRGEVLVFAIEILIFTTPSLTILFVSKADSSGFSSRLNMPKGSPSAVAAISSTFIEFLLEPRLTKSRVVLSLFARAQNQYLFPGSVENVGKHVLNDHQLVKWWCRVLDKVLRVERLSTTSSAHLIVPGCDRAETKAFFPPSSRADPPSDPKWINSYPVDLMVVDTSKPPRQLIPHFPDDPKSRFLDDLDGDFIDDQGHWRSVRTLDHFWEMMSYRQECSAGRLVGFVWLVFSSDEETQAALSDLKQDGEAAVSQELLVDSSVLTPMNSQLEENGISKPTIPLDLQSPPPSSPLQAVLTALPPIPDAAPPVPPVPTEISTSTATEKTKGEIVVDASQYQSVMDFLLQTDFAGDTLASENSRAWVQKVLEFSQTTEFGRLVHGCDAQVSTQSNGSVNASASQVNVLTGIRKKRKADILESTTTQDESKALDTVSAATTLSASLVRKKPKS